MCSCRRPTGSPAWADASPDRAPSHDSSRPRRVDDGGIHNGPPADLQAFKEELKALQKKVDEQSVELQPLKNPPPKKKPTH